jgi:hypothetical protein
MRKTRASIATLIVVVLLLLVNIVAFNWTSKFFRSRYGVGLVRYGDSMPNLAGLGYSGDQTFSINVTKPTLVIYLTGSGIKGQTIALLKLCENLRQQSPTQFQTTLITSGLLPEIQQLLRDNLIGYPIINDSDGQLAKRLGLETEESGNFFFDKSGLCRFATRQQPTPGDLRQLLTAFGLGTSADNESTDRLPLSNGKPLPSLGLLDPRTLRRVTTNQLSSTNDEQVWIFFLANFFACGAPDPSYYLQQFKHWRQAARNTATDPVIIFDSAFLRNEVTAALERLEINSPAYLADEDLSSFSHFVMDKGRRTDQPLIIRTDSSHAISSVSLIGSTHNVSSSDKPDEKPAVSNNATQTYTRIFQDLGLDVYDVASYNGAYYVSDRSRNSIVVVNERFEIQRVIGGIGSAPGRLFRPGYIDVSTDGLIYVQDGGNERIQCFSIDGTYVAGFATKPYMGMAAGLNGEVYLGQPENGALVSVYSRSGKHLRSFGKLKSYSELMGKEFEDLNEQYAQAANRVRIFMDKDGSMLVSFMLVPFIQKYSPDGKLLFESRLEGPEIDALRQTPGLLTVSMDGLAETILALEAVALPNGEINVVLTDGSIYVTDQSGRRQRVVQLQAGNKFTPEMTGITPAGALLIVGMNPRTCYRVSAN